MAPMDNLEAKADPPHGHYLQLAPSHLEPQAMGHTALAEGSKTSRTLEGQVHRHTT